MIAKFGEFTLDSDSRQLTRGRKPLHLSRKAFDALCVLLERRPSAVTKEELHARLWPGTFVVDANLSVAIAEIRRALGDDAQAPRFIRTVHRIGYAFCSDPPGTGRANAGEAERRAWLVWNDRIFQLGEGENLVGRDPECHVWLDVRGVSRRHACIRVVGDAATIEDLGSKNGTSINESPVGPARPLSDGDSLRLGGAELGFRTNSSPNATETIRLKKS